MRLRGLEDEGSYGDASLAAWAKRIASIQADPIYIFFNNDRAGNAVGDALRLTEAVEAQGTRVLRPFE